jgi:hypothetical protein
MADPFQPVKQGAPAEISARTFNGVLKSAQDYSRRKLDEDRNQYDGTGIDPIYPPQIYNGLSAALGEFSVLGFGPVARVDPSVVPFEASSSPVFDAAIPDASKPFCITREPIPVGAIGQVVMTGPAVVRVNVTNDTHAFAVATTGVTDYLTSAASGGAPILWKERGTGTKWATVLLGNTVRLPTTYVRYSPPGLPFQVINHGTYEGFSIGKLVVPRGDYLVTASGIVGGVNLGCNSGSVVFYVGVSMWDYPGNDPFLNGALFAPKYFQYGIFSNTTFIGDFSISVVLPGKIAGNTALMSIGTLSSVMTNTGSPPGSLGFNVETYSLTATPIALANSLF